MTFETTRRTYSYALQLGRKHIVLLKIFLCLNVTCKRRLEDRIKVGLQEMGWDGINWIDVAEDELPGSVKCMELPV